MKPGWRVCLRAQVGALDLDVDLRGGETPLALVGPNGGGKTTLLRTIAGVFEPTAGEIKIGSRILFCSEKGICLAPEERRLGYVPQGYGLFSHLRVIDNVAFGLCIGNPRAGARSSGRRAAQAVLDELGCGALAPRWPQTLSGGEQQQVALARALAISPSMLLLDEPLAALDAGARRRVRSFLAARLRSLACPSIVVTHDPRDVAALNAHVCVLEGGRVVQEGSLEHLQRKPASDFVAEFATVPHAPPPSSQDLTA